MYDTVIIGAGPAGMAAAIYAMRAGLNLALIEKNPVSGGQVLNTWEVDNYPGLPGINGFDLGMKFKEHVDRLAAPCIDDEVTGIAREETADAAVYRIRLAEGGELVSRTVILAAGASHAKLGVPGEEALTGKGVSYCATCDGNFFRGREAAVIGGGDVAVEDAIYLSRICSRVTLIHRRDALRATKVLQEELFGISNITVRWNAVVKEIQGTDRVTGLTLEDTVTGARETLAVDAAFVAVGILPDTGLAAGLVETDAGGYIPAGEDGATALPGFFVAGDARKKRLRQIVTAVADGANAATEVHDYLMRLKK